jgi:hypothetical protein
VHIVGDEALRPTADEVRVWACQAWEALTNVGKYVRRSSYWEALDQLHEARTSLSRLGAGRARAPGPLWAIGAHRRWGEDAAQDRQVRPPGRRR